MRTFVVLVNINKQKERKQMNQEIVISKLNELKLEGFKTAYIRQLEDRNYDKLSFNEKLYNLLETQEIFQHNKKIQMNSRLSKIKDKQASLEELEYKATRGLDKEQILSLANMDFIRNYQNLIITGKTGTGKSYLAQAFANKSIVDGFKAYYIRVPLLLETIAIARADGTYTNFLRKLAKFNLLILDDFGINPLSADDATNLLEIIEDRVNLSSVIITSQLPVSKWYEYLNNDTVADAILDRIVYSSHRIELKGDSMRKIMSKI
jgi:DNA replication protein DnaC